MHDPEEFQKQTEQAIKGLQEFQVQLQSRQLGITAFLTALLSRFPPEGLPAFQEVYDQAVDNLAAQLHPKYQQPKYWLEWSELMSETIAAHRAKQPKKPS